MSALWYDIKKQFPIFSNNNTNLIYLDNASTVQKPQSVITAMSDYISQQYANIHRWVYALAEQSEELYMQSKQKLAKFINVEYREIIYTYNATYASNMLAQSLVQTYTIWQWDVVLVWIRDHHATIVPRQLLAQQHWFEVKFIMIDHKTLEINWKLLWDMIEQYNPKVIMCSHVSNVTWIVYDVKRIASMIKSISENTFFAVDGSQAIPHMQVDIKDIGCDAYFFTGHKMMWPTGIWVLWIDKSLVRRLQTTLWWWGIIESVTTESCSLIRTADKFEPGTPNLIWAIGLWAACDFYEENNIYEYIHSHEKILYDAIVKWIQSFGGVIDIFWWLTSLQNCGIVSLIVDDPLWFSEYLADHDICVRAWWHCAHPLLHYLWQDKWTVRISPFVYNTLDDVGVLLDRISNYIAKL